MQKISQRFVISIAMILLSVAAVSAVIILPIHYKTWISTPSAQQMQSNGSLSTQSLYATVSPNRTYRVEISQKWDSAGYERYVYLNASRGGDLFVRNKLLYTGDLLDSDFRDLYPNYSWISNSAIKIGQGLAEMHPNNLIITNGTPNRIRYLLIETYKDKYILFDVEPGSVIHISFQFIGQLSCQGEFVESQKRFGSAVRLIDDTKRDVQGEFSIRVDEDRGPLIESQSLKLKRVTCCAVDRPDIHHENY